MIIKVTYKYHILGWRLALKYCNILLPMTASNVRKIGMDGGYEELEVEAEVMENLTLLISSGLKSVLSWRTCRT